MGLKQRRRKNQKGNQKGEREMNEYIFVIPMILISSIVSFFVRDYETRKIEFVNSEETISIDVQIADNIFKKSLGLMYRETIGDEEGMLFIFEKEKKPRFWMKNMKFPIDIIFVSKDFEIVEIVENAQPCNSWFCFGFKPERPAKYVIETKAGFCKKHGIKIGDKCLCDF